MRPTARRWGGGALLVPLLSACASPPEPGWPQFADVAREAGLTRAVVAGTAAKAHILEVNTGGCALFDYDGDGDRDLFLVNGGRFPGSRPGPEAAILYRNDGGWRYADATAQAGVGHRGWGMGATAWDVDGDGWTDLLVTGYGADVLYRNRGDGTFSADSASGLGDPGWSTGVGAADYDGDGDVDAYVARYIDLGPDVLPPPAPPCIWRGVPAFCGPAGLPGATDLLFFDAGPQPGRVWVDASERLGPDRPAYYGLGVLAGDFDDDGDPDIYVANDATPNLFYENDGGAFRDTAGPSGTAVSADGRRQAGMGVAAGDIDGDGGHDLVVSNFSHDHVTLYMHRGPQAYEDASFAGDVGRATLATLGWGVGLVDFDNDADLDLFVANGHVYPAVDRAGIGTTYRQANQVFANEGGLLWDVGARSGPGLAVLEASRGAAFGDLDDDGAVDVLVVNLDAPPTLLRNRAVAGRHWLTAELIGTRANRSALGARVEVLAGGRRQRREVRAGTGYLSQDDLRLHFGLGEATRARVSVRWPDGVERDLGEVPADRHLRIERDGGLSAL